VDKTVSRSVNSLW